MKERITSIILLIILVSVIVLFIGVAIYFFSPTDMMNRRVEAFDDLYDLYVEHGSRYALSKEKDLSYYELCNTLHSECGLACGFDDDSGYIMDDIFVESYIASHSVEEFITKLYFITDNYSTCCRTIGNDPYDYCISRTSYKTLMKALEIGQIELTQFKLPAEGTEGYYTEHPDEVLPDRTWEEKGRFYTASGEHGHTESRPCSVKVTVHGDFLVEHGDVYRYDEGAYEWRNGEFIDILPSFHHKLYTSFYYKGEPMYRNPTGAQSFCIDGTVYLLYSAEEWSAGDHLVFPWESLD